MSKGGGGVNERWLFVSAERAVCEPRHMSEQGAPHICASHMCEQKAGVWFVENVGHEHKGECADAVYSGDSLAYLDRRTCAPLPTSDAHGNFSKTSPPESSTPGQGTPGHPRKLEAESGWLRCRLSAHGYSSIEGRGPRATRTPQRAPWWSKRGQLPL